MYSKQHLNPYNSLQVNKFTNNIVIWCIAYNLATITYLCISISTIILLPRITISPQLDYESFTIILIAELCYDVTILT
jgi:hypothetical protein